MDRFRGLIVAALLAGSAAGLVLFAPRRLTLIPLIDRAEVFEEAAIAHAGHVHPDESWQPAPGIARVSLTAISAMLSGIGFAAILLAVCDGLNRGAGSVGWQGRIFAFAHRMYADSMRIS